MKAKNLFTVVLLLFVAASLLVIVVRALRQQPAVAQTDGSADHAPAAQDAAAAPPATTDGVIAYCFHGNVRCPTCREIEASAHKALAAGFADQIEQRTLVWRVVNYEQPGNEHFATDFSLIAPTVVLVKMANGKQIDWKNLDRVWELVGDDAAFSKYVQQETHALLAATPTTSAAADARAAVQRR